MSREIKISDDDWGEYELFVLWENEEDGTWEDEEWEQIRELEEVQPLIQLFSNVTWESYEDSLHGDSMPLIRELGIPPKSCLVKGNIPISKCFFFEECPAYDESECFGHKDPPPCFNASIKEADFQVRDTVSKIYRYWQQGIWIIIVQEGTFR